MIDVKVIGSGSSGNCYLLDDGTSQLLIEAGVQFKYVQRAMDFDFTRLEGILISHEHSDHTKYLSQVYNASTAPVIASQGTFESMHLNPNYHEHEIAESLVPLKVGDWTVIPFAVEHDAAEPLGFMVENKLHERLLYVTDTYYVKWHFSHLSYLMVEMNYDEEIAADRVAVGAGNSHVVERNYTSHFEIKNSLDFIKSNLSPELKWVMLLHLSDSNSDESEFKRRTQQVAGVPVYVAPKTSW